MRDATTATTPATGGAVGVSAGGALAGAGGAAAGGEAAALVEQLDRVLGVGADELDRMPEQDLRERVALAHRLQGLATATLASAVAALDRSGVVRADGASSVAAWLADTTGTSRRAASQTTRLAADLEAMPDTRTALTSGDISVEAAGIVLRAARDGRLGPPERAEADLLPVARIETPERLRAHVARRTQQVDGAALARDESRQRTLRRFTLTRQNDGMWRPGGLLPDEVGEKAATLLDAYMTVDPQGSDPEVRRRPDQRMADAFEAIVDVALGLGPTPTTGGVARPHLSVVVDLATLDADLTDPDRPDRPVAPDDPAWADLPAGQTAWGQTMSPQAVRKLCCDANISRIVTAGEPQVLDVGRATQSWSAPQRRAVAVRDRSCRGPGCGRPIGWTQVHHLRWWSNNGPTNIDNGLAVCCACHDLIHHHGWTVELDPTTAAATWHSPTGREVVTHPRPPT